MTKKEINLFPKYIRIGGYDFEIIFTNDEWSEDRIGSAHFYPDKKIKLLKISGIIDNYSTLFHELHHAIDFVHGLIGAKETTEEQYCKAFGESWLQITRDNPKLVKLINYVSKLPRKAA